MLWCLMGKLDLPIESFGYLQKVKSTKDLSSALTKQNKVLSFKSTVQF